MIVLDSQIPEGYHELQVSLEALEDGMTAEGFKDSMKGVTKFLSRLFDGKKLNEELDLPVIVPGFLDKYVASDKLITKAVKNATKAGYDNYSETMVRLPIQVAEGVRVVRYADALNEAFNILAGIHSRVLQPLQEWTAGVLRDEQYLEKNWLHRVEKAKLNDVTRILTPVYSAGSDGMRSERHLALAYTTIKDIVETGRLISVMVNSANTTLELEPKRIIDEIVDNIKKIVAMNEEGDVFTRIPKATMKTLAELLYVGAQEIEAYSTLVLQVHTLAVSYKETLEIVVKGPVFD